MSVRSSDALGSVLEQPRSGHRLEVLSALGALVLHAGLAAWIPHVKAPPAVAEPPPTQWLTQDVPPASPPKDEPAKEQEMPKPAPDVAKAAQPTAAPPPPAQAAAVLTQQEDPSAPMDFTNSMVVGNAETYVGGITSSTGTGTKPRVVGSPSSTGGTGTVPTAPAPALAPSGPDLSRRARLAGGVSWSCAFPAEADADQIDHAVVTLRITVDAAGAVTDVSVVADPGHGFGREAQACARRKRFDPALDRDGHPVTGTSAVNVRFER